MDPTYCWKVFWAGSVLQLLPLALLGVWAALSGICVCRGACHGVILTYMYVIICSNFFEIV